MIDRKWPAWMAFGVLVATAGLPAAPGQGFAPSREVEPPRPAGSAGRIGQWLAAPAGFPAAERPKLPKQPYLGTQVRSEPVAAGEARELRDRVGRAFEAQDPAPPGRAGHFEWIARMSPDRVQRVGWLGSIREVRPACGGCTVVVDVYPWLRSIHRFSAVVDKVCETYFYDGATFRLDATDAAEVDPSLHVFPIAY